jgi:hypothetical protein
MMSRLLNVFRWGFVGQIMVFFVDRGARNRTLFDRFARVVVGWVFLVPKKDDFMADDLVDNDQGYDLAELRRYQSGK